VLCLGNELVADDGVGPAVARLLRERSVDAEIVESFLAGLGLLDDLLGVERLIVVDAVYTGETPPGSVHVLNEADVSASPAGWQHSMGLFEAIGLARALHLGAPSEVVMVAVEVSDLLNVGGPLTPEVEASVPVAAGVVEGLLAGTAD
jgi:hydrogenase maturation protease